MFKIVGNKGFHIKFENGITISCQIGSGNYCDNRDHNAEFQKEMKQRITECENCEVAIWGENGNWITEEVFKELNLGTETGNGTVVGWVDADTVGQIIAYILNRQLYSDDVES